MESIEKQLKVAEQENRVAQAIAYLAEEKNKFACQKLINASL